MGIRNSALLEPGHPRYEALAGAASTIGTDLAQTYLSTCRSCKEFGVLCEDHRATVIEVDGGGTEPAGYWQSAGPADATMVMTTITD